MKKFVLGSLMVFCLLSCQSDTKEEKTYKDGLVYSKAIYKNGELDEVIYYYKTGEIWVKEYYVNDKLHGPHHKYYKSGRLFAVVNYHEDSVTSNYFFNEAGDTLSKQENGKTIMRFYNLKLKGIYCNADTSNFSVIEFDSVRGEIVRFIGNLHCLDKKDSMILNQDYPNWQNSISNFKGIPN